jgi:hypothetical protein
MKYVWGCIFDRNKNSSRISHHIVIIALYVIVGRHNYGAVGVFIYTCRALENHHYSQILRNQAYISGCMGVEMGGIGKK